MIRYPVDVFWSDEDGAFVADVPDLPACSAFGATPEEALREARVARALWLESARAHGDPIPEPTGHPEAARAAGGCRSPLPPPPGPGLARPPGLRKPPWTPAGPFGVDSIGSPAPGGARRGSTGGTS